MAGDVMAGARQTGRARTGSRSLPLRLHQRQPGPAAPVDSAHLSDPYLQGFLDPAFDPTEHLNSVLPSLQTPGRPGQGSVPLAELSAQAQTLVSQLNAHTTRMTGTLTQLTDDIMRSGSRLAYEVELLRGETLGLAEALTDGLEADVATFVPGGIQDGPGAKAPAAAAGAATPAEAPVPDALSRALSPNEPPHITRLRTLALVRSRLDSVIKTFGEAMEFVFPPSELSVSSSFLSVSGPDPGPERHSTEEKGQRVLRSLRAELAGLLDDAEDPVRGIEDGVRRIEQLRDLAGVWKGTAEEKGRARFIESLAKMVEDRHRDLLREMEQQIPPRRGEDRPETGSPPSQESGEADAGAANGRGYGGLGLISQLQKLRGGL